MANLLIGDIHGCMAELERLLAKAGFNPNVDTLWLTGDLVARGPDSLQVLRYIKSLGPTVRMVLGNHDLHLLAIYSGISRDRTKNRLADLLTAPDVDELINWLRRQPLMQIDDSLKLIMVHAGISPQWELATAEKCARDVEMVLRSDAYPLFLNAMYGDLPNIWSDKLQGLARLRYITNAFTRMRYCYANGGLDMLCKDSLKEAPIWLKPWFSLPGPILADYQIAFGHWAALGGKDTPERVYALDTGCCWGGSLTLLRWEDQRYFRQRAL